MKNGFRNWSDVRVFLAVVREGSTLAASKGLGMAQPTVARRIEALEHALGMTLFERDTRGFRPTAQGQSLVPFAEAIEAAATAFGDKAQELSRPRPIRITAYSANFSPRAQQIFIEFSMSHPGVRFEFLPATEVLDLKKGAADIALRLTRVPPDPDLICRKISTARFTLWGTPAYARTYGLPTGPDDLAGHRFVTFRRESTTPALHDWVAKRVDPAQIIGTYPDVDLVDSVIKSGHALGLDNLRKNQGDPELIACFEPPEELNAEHLLLVSPEAWRRPEVKAFTKFFAPRYAALYR